LRDSAHRRRLAQLRGADAPAAHHRNRTVFRAMVGYVRCAGRSRGPGCRARLRYVPHFLSVRQRTLRPQRMIATASVWVVGTFDTKADELAYLVSLIRQAGVPALTVDISTREHSSK